MKLADVNEIRKEFQRKLENEEFVIDKSGVKTIEIMNASFNAKGFPSIFGEPNKEYIQKEIEWYRSTSLNVYDMPNPPEIWKQVADKDGNINSNYGWCVWSKDNHHQFQKVIRTLNKNPDSRQAIMIYTRPTMHEDYNENGRSDFMCTNTVQYLIRDNKLHSIVNMRSNDAVFGYKNDYAWQLHVQLCLLNMMRLIYPEIELGELYWNAGSLHVYERHFDFVRNMGPDLMQNNPEDIFSGVTLKVEQ